jgi:hypothetical protein
MRTDAMLVACLLSAAPVSAGAVSVSMSEVELGAAATVETCKADGTAVLEAAGMKALPAAPLSVFATGPADSLAVIYCLPARGIAIVTIAGDEQAVTRRLLAEILGGMRQRQ